MQLFDDVTPDIPKRRRFLKYFDPNANNGRGYIETTNDVFAAKKFSDVEQVTLEWQLQSEVLPLLSEGKPNKPLMIYSIMALSVDGE